MLPLWRLFGDKTFKVHFEPKQQWHNDKRNLHTIPDDEQHPPCLCTTNNHRGRCCLLYVDFSGTKHSRYILNHNNDVILTKRSYTQYQRMNNIHHALYYLQPQGKMLSALWRLLGDQTFKVNFEPQQLWHINKRKGISYTHCQRMNNIHHALYYVQPHRKMLPTLWRLFGGQNVQGTFWSTTTMT